MKKFLVVLLALVVAGGAFAQLADGISFGVWGQVGFTALEAQFYANSDKLPDGHDKDGDLHSALGPYWGWGTTHGRPARLQFAGSAERIGFNLWLETDNGGVRIGDYASIWALPWDFLRIELGQFNNDTLRGKVGDTSTHPWVLESWTGPNYGDQDQIFHRFVSKPGAMFSLLPVEGLFIGAKVDVPFGTSQTALGQSGGLAKEVWSTLQVGAGYEIEGVGHARAQFLMNGLNTDAGRFDLSNFDPLNPVFSDIGLNLSRVELAFAITALEDMLFDIGVKIPFAYKTNFGAGGDDIAFSGPFQLGLGADMSFGDFGINALVCASFGGGVEVDKDNKFTNGADVNIHLYPSFKISDTDKLALELGLNIVGSSKTKAAGTDLDYNDGVFNLGAGLWYIKDLGNGNLSVGATFTSQGFSKDFKDAPGYKDSAYESAWFRIPIVLQVYF